MNRKIKTYPTMVTYHEMNKMIKDFLRAQGDNYTLYAAQRIEELEKESERLKKRAREVRKEAIMELLELLKFGYDLPIDEIAEDIIKKYKLLEREE